MKISMRESRQIIRLDGQNWVFNLPVGDHSGGGFYNEEKNNDPSQSAGVEITVIRGGKA